MEKKNIFNSRKAVYITFAVVIVALVCIAEYFTNKNIGTIISSTISYNIRSTEDYKVTYKENNFYDDEIETSTYITQYVDKIKLNFNYDVNYTNEVDGSYYYNVKAKLITYTPNNEDDILWSEEYVLSEQDVATAVLNQNKVNVSDSISINFNDYLKEYNKWKKALNGTISSSAKLIVTVNIYNTAIYGDLDNISFNNTLTYEIPLSDATFKISVYDDITDDEVKYEETTTDEQEKMLMMIAIGLIWVLVIFVCFCYLIVYLNDVKKISKYDKLLRKILTTYDGIIVNVEKLPVLKDLSVVNVTTFEELVDAQNEVRLPINFKEDRKKKIAKFVLVRNNLAWVYTLKGGDTVEEENI